MSFGFSGGDIAIAISIVKHAYDTYSQSPKDYKIFLGEVHQLQNNIKKAQELCKNTQWSSGDRSRLNSYASDLNDLSEDLSTRVEKYKSLANGHGRKWDRIRWSSEDVEKLRIRILTLNSSLNTFLNLVLISSRDSSDRDSYESSLVSSASDQQTLTSITSQNSCDQPRSPKSPFFESLRFKGSSLDAGYGGGLSGLPTNKSVKGVATKSEAQRTRSAGEADQPKPQIPKKKPRSFSLGWSSPSLTEVLPPFAQDKSSQKPYSQRNT